MFLGEGGEDEVGMRHRKELPLGLAALGCTFAENVYANHHIAFKQEQMDEAIAAVKKQIIELGGEVTA